jgi:thiopeptide-type bacteriocin biosynthesis protein
VSAAGFSLAETIGVRIPSLPVEQLAALYREDDVAGALYALLARRGEAYQVLKLASASLAHGIDRWLADPTGDHERCISSALAYVARCATRCTPLAACATVSLTGLGDDAALRLSGPIATRTRLDAEWLYEVGTSYERRPQAVAELLLRAGGNAFTVGERLEVLDAARAEMRTSGDAVAIAATPTGLNFTPAVRATLEEARLPIRGHLLADRVAARIGAPYGAVLELLAKLVELGILLSELRTPLVADQGEHLAAVVTRIDGEAGARLERLAAGLREVDGAPFAERSARLTALGPAAEAFAQAKQFYQIDASRAVEGSVPPAFARRVEDAFAALARISSPNRHARRIAELFAGKYNEGREVPLLRLLEARQSFDFESAVASLPAQRYSNDYQEELLALAVTANARGESEVRLDDLLPRLASDQPERRLAANYEGLVHVLRDAAGELVPGVWSGFLEGSGRALTRFADMLGDEVPALLRHGSTGTAAELSSLPRVRRSLNVMTRANPFPYELVDGLWPAADPEHTLTLDDIVVGVAGGRIYLRSERLGTVLAVHQSHLARQTGNSRVGTFLATIAQSDVPYVGFAWGSAAAKLPFKPRVTVAGAVAAPATWRVPAAVAREFDGPRGREWRALWNVPRRVYLTQFDNRVLLDLERAVCRAQIAAFAAKSRTARTVELHEALPDFTDAAVAGPAGTHVAELAVTLHGPAAPAPAVRVPACLGAAHYLRPPGTDWVYARCYLPLDRAAYFLERNVGALLRELDGAFGEAHFIRYLDPEPHVRLRLRGTSGESAAALLAAVVERGGRCVREGTIERFELGTYDREVERYGGPAAIEPAERVFSADSELVLALLPALRLTDKPFAALVADVARVVLCLHPSLADAVAWAKDAFGRRPRLDATAWDAIKAVRVALRGADPRYGDLALRARAHLAAVSAADRPNVARALLHMHCNRLGVGRSEELRLGHCAAAVLEGELLRAAGAAPAAS